jgi:hypothetical protein
VDLHPGEVITETRQRRFEFVVDAPDQFVAGLDVLVGVDLDLQD